MKLIDIFQTASGNLWQSKLRTFLTVIAVFIGAFTLTLTSGIGAGISEYIDAQVGSIGAKNVLMIVAKTDTDMSISAGTAEPQKYDPEKMTRQQSAERGGMTVTQMTDNDIAKIKAEPGIIDVNPYRNVSISYIYGSSSQKYLLSVSEYIEGTNVAMNAGLITDNASLEDQLTIPYNYVKSLGFTDYADAIGKTVTLGVPNATGQITEVTAKVVGVPQKSLITSSGGMVNKAFFTKLFNLQNAGLPANTLNRYNQVVAHFDPQYSDSQVTDLKNRLDKLGFVAQTIADTIATIKQIINSIVIVFDIFAVIALLAASFGVINTLLMSVQERTKEIGLMKAMGMSRGRIFSLFSTEAILLGFWGSFLGVIIAMGVGTVANKIAANGFLKDFEGLNLLTFPIDHLVWIVLGIMFVAFLAGTLPARRASGLNPIDALRYE